MQEFLFVIVIGALLFVIFVFIIAFVYLFQELQEARTKTENIIKTYEVQLRDNKAKQQYEIEKARHQSVEFSRRTIKGQVAEQFAPLLQGFPYLPSDSHFIGDPVDYVVFNGYTELRDNHNPVDNLELVIIDIKYNKAQLSEGQKRIAKAVEAGKVRFEVVKVLEDGKVEVQSWDSPWKNRPESNVAETNSHNKTSEWQRNWDEFLKKYPKAYEPWDETDDILLKDKYLAGMKINDIALFLKRNPYKVRMRIKKKNLENMRNLQNQRV